MPFTSVIMYIDKEKKMIVCSDCLLLYREDVYFRKRSEAIEHLKQHIAANHEVEDKAIPILETQIGRHGDEID